MARPRSPVFLARTSYRRRRLRDASWLLPILGMLLLALPLLWIPDVPNPQAAPQPNPQAAPLPGRLTAGDVGYFFSVWLFLIAVAAAFAPGLERSDGAEEAED